MSNNLGSVAEDLTYFGSEVLSQLQNRLTLVQTVRRSYQGAEESAGSNVQIPYITISGGATARAIGGAATASDVDAQYTTVVLGQIYQAASIDNLQKTFQNIDLMAETAARLAYNLAAASDSKIAALWNEIPNEVGTLDGTSIFNATDDINVFAAARKKLSANQAPLDLNNIHAVINPSEAYALRTLTSYKQANFSGTAEGRRTGDLYDTFGFQIHESQQIQDATLSVAAEWLSPGAVVGAFAKGASAVAINSVGVGTIKKGSTFTIGTAAYSVTADATITANAATVSIYPKLKVALVGGEAVTAVVHSADASMNLMYHSDAFLFVARPSAAFAQGSGVTSVVVRDPQTGLGLRVSHQSQLLGSAGVAMTESILVDIVCGAKTVRPEWAIKATGQITT